MTYSKEKLKECLVVAYEIPAVYYLVKQKYVNRYGEDNFIKKLESKLEKEVNKNEV